MDHRHLASYAGREQAAVKHFLVDSYLERLIMITAQAKYHRIAYVDGFAGPWKSAREDLGDTSFGRAVEVMKRCRVELARRFKRSVTFRALFRREGSRDICEGPPVCRAEVDSHHIADCVERGFRVLRQIRC